MLPYPNGESNTRMSEANKVFGAWGVFSKTPHKTFVRRYIKSGVFFQNTPQIIAIINSVSRQYL